MAAASLAAHRRTHNQALTLTNTHEKLQAHIHTHTCAYPHIHTLTHTRKQGVTKTLMPPAASVN